MQIYNKRYKRLIFHKNPETVRSGQMIGICSGQNKKIVVHHVAGSQCIINPQRLVYSSSVHPLPVCAQVTTPVTRETNR